MVFNSIDFFIFFPIVLFLYFIIPRKLRYVWLLVISYYFYMSWNPKYAVLMAFSTVVTYSSGILLGWVKETHGQRAEYLKKWIVAGSFFCNIGILFFFKYFDFALETVNRVLDVAGIQLLEKPFDVLLPVGISFYTFQALGYTVDVYREDIEPEKNIIRYALFVSFFPQLLSGPIERSTNMIKQIRQVHTFKLWNYERVTAGMAQMLWGYFLKMVLADRLVILVDTVFSGYAQYGSVILIVAAVVFGFQIYCDFASYSWMAIGCANMLGFTIMDNFKAPYFSTSIKEFWQRWHISLSSWFRDYLYIPLGGNRKGRWRKYGNLLLTFLISGLWHGASFSFIVWGGLNGIYQIVGDMTRPIRAQCLQFLHIKKDGWFYKLWQRIVTFVLVDFAWIFFRCSSLRESLDYIRCMVRVNDLPNLWNGALYTLGLNRTQLWIAVIGLIVLLLADWIQYKKDLQLYEYLNTKPLVIRWAAYLLLVVGIYIFGIYGFAYDATQFYYFQF